MNPQQTSSSRAQSKHTGPEGWWRAVWGVGDSSHCTNRTHFMPTAAGKHKFIDPEAEPTCHVGPLGGADQLSVYHKLRGSGMQAGARVQKNKVITVAGLVAHCTPLACCLLPITNLLMRSHPSCHLHTTSRSKLTHVSVCKSMHFTVIINIPGNAHEAQDLSVCFVASSTT